MAIRHKPRSMEILMTCAGLAQPSPRLVCMWRSARLYAVGVVRGAMLLDTSGRISIFFVLSYVCDYGFALPLYHMPDRTGQAQGPIHLTYAWSAHHSRLGKRAI